MIEEEAVVTRVEGNRVAVEKERKSACSGCQQSSCASSVTSRLFEGKTVSLWASASGEFKPGDRVVIGLREDALVQGAFLIYVVPLAGLLAGALLGQFVADQTGLLDSDMLSALGGIGGMGLFFAGIRFSSFKLGTDASPVVLRKIS